MWGGGEGLEYKRWCMENIRRGDWQIFLFAHTGPFSILCAASPQENERKKPYVSSVVGENKGFDPCHHACLT